MKPGLVLGRFWGGKQIRIELNKEVKFGAEFFFSPFLSGNRDGLEKQATRTRARTASSTPLIFFPLPCYQLGLGGLFHRRRPPVSPPSQFLAPYAVHCSKQCCHAVSEGASNISSTVLNYSICGCTAVHHYKIIWHESDTSFSLRVNFLLIVILFLCGTISL